MSTYDTATTNGPSSTEQVKDKAQEAAGQARRGIRDQVDTRSTDAGHRVGGMAQDVRSVSEELRKQGKDQPARLAEQAADRADKLGDYLKRADGDTILRDVEDFGRERPWAVIAGGLALGFAASRFLKASSSRRYEARWESSDRLPARRVDVAPPIPAQRVDVTPPAPAQRVDVTPPAPAQRVDVTPPAPAQRVDVTPPVPAQTAGGGPLDR